jgi:single-strand DNA-binding protein
MASFNKVLLMGNLTRDPQMKYLPSQTAVCEFGIASNRKFRTQGGEDREEVCFVDCTAFGRTGEVINQYMQKGRPIFIEGRLKFDSWDDKQSGQKRSKLGVVVDNFQFIGGREDGGGPGGGGGGGGGYSRGNSSGGGDSYQQDRPAPRRGGPPREQASKQPADEPFDEGEQFGEDDIPF